MGNALAFVVVGGVISTGTLWHFNYCLAAIVVGVACYAAARWIFVNYA